MGFGSGSTANVFLVLIPSLFQYPKAIKSLKLKGDSYASSIIGRHPFRVGDLGHDIEQFWTFFRVPTNVAGTRSCEEVDGGKGILPQVL
jgi:hypothetical protein